MSMRRAQTQMTMPTLSALGLAFNPFEHLEASADPHLNAYLMGHDLFGMARAEEPSLFFAPTGGGKTAMRLYATRSCWVGISGTHPLPVSFAAPSFVANARPLSASAVTRLCLQACAASLLTGLAFRPERFLALDHADQVRLASLLLTGLAFRPERFLALDHADQARLASLLDQALPEPLAYYMSALRAQGTPLILSALLDRAYQLSEIPPRQKIITFCDALTQFDGPRAAPTDVETPWEALTELALGPLAFRAIFILLDGVDAFPETADQPDRIAHWLAPFIARTREWSERKIYLKCFLPLEAEWAVTKAGGAVLTRTRFERLVWAPPLLAEMLRRRIYIASSGKFDSLDAISGPGLRDVEAMLAGNVKPLPREAIWIANETLRAFLQRARSDDARLEPRDVETAHRKYRKDLTALNPPRVHGASAWQPA